MSGTDGTAWINGEEWAELKAIEAKVTGEFEDVTFCGDYGTYKRFMGRTCEGTLTLNKVMSRGMKLMAEAFKTGVMPDIKIITKLVNKQTGKAERVALKDVVFSEFAIAKFENRSLLEEELPFTFSDYDILEAI
nr:phage tail tube protein [Paenibacillus aquistagni]